MVLPLPFDAAWFLCRTSCRLNVAECDFRNTVLHLAYVMPYYLPACSIVGCNGPYKEQV